MGPLHRFVGLAWPNEALQCRCAMTRRRSRRVSSLEAAFQPRRASDHGGLLAGAWGGWRVLGADLGLFEPAAPAKTGCTRPGARTSPPWATIVTITTSPAAGMHAIGRGRPRDSRVAIDPFNFSVEFQ